MGRIVTVSDSAGRSVTVSNWGVAQTSRHRLFEAPKPNVEPSHFITVHQPKYLEYIFVEIFEDWGVEEIWFGILCDLVGKGGLGPMSRQLGISATEKSRK
jgi:hypothetical protein